MSKWVSEDKRFYINIDVNCVKVKILGRSVGWILKIKQRNGPTRPFIQNNMQATTLFTFEMIFLNFSSGLISLSLFNIRKSFSSLIAFCLQVVADVSKWSTASETKNTFSSLQIKLFIFFFFLCRASRNNASKYYQQKQLKVLSVS